MRVMIDVLFCDDNIQFAQPQGENRKGILILSVLSLSPSLDSLLIVLI